MSRRLIVGLDLSLSGTGIARLEVTPGVLGPQRYSAAFRTDGSKPPTPPMGEKAATLAQRSTRLRRMAHRITQQCVGADLVVVEGPSFASSGSGTWDRAGLWWLVVGRLTGADLNVVEVPPSNVKTYATGSGNAAKDAVLAAVVRRYPEFAGVSNNNEADALVLAAMAARWMGQPIEESLPQTHTRAIKTVRWLPTAGGGR